MGLGFKRLPPSKVRGEQTQLRIAWGGTGVEFWLEPELHLAAALDGASQRARQRVTAGGLVAERAAGSSVVVERLIGCGRSSIGCVGPLPLAHRKLKPSRAASKPASVEA